MVGAIRELPRFSCTVRTEKTVCFFSLKSFLSAGRTSLLAKRYNVVQMRQFFSSKSCVRLLSLPMRGEWIEMAARWKPTTASRCLSPCGESGLKCLSRPDRKLDQLSLPMRGEWIEIIAVIQEENRQRVSPCGESGLKFKLRAGKGLRAVSLPMRGEWIEIQKRRVKYGENSRLSPCGESGLKLKKSAD